MPLCSQDELKRGGFKLIRVGFVYYCKFFYSKIKNPHAMHAGF